jgi:adenylylsulfate kinase
MNSLTNMERMNKNGGFVLWFTGLSGSGKSTLIKAVDNWLSTIGLCAIGLDGDQLRQGLCSDLGFSREDRKENARRISEVAKLCADSEAIVLVALISPFRADRRQAREIVGGRRFIEIYCDCPMDVCRERDVKGLYRRALAGEVRNFTGISSPYEAPVEPELILKTAVLDEGECLQLIMNVLAERGILS